MQEETAATFSNFESFQFQCYTIHSGSLLQYQCNSQDHEISCNITQYYAILYRLGKYNNMTIQNFVLPTPFVNGESPLWLLL